MKFAGFQITKLLSSIPVPLGQYSAVGQHSNKQRDGIIKFLQQAPAFITTYALLIQEKAANSCCCYYRMIYFITFHQFVGNLTHAVDLTSCRCNSENQRIPYVAREDKNAPLGREHWLLTKHSQNMYINFISHENHENFSGCLRHPKTVISLY